MPLQTNLGYTFSKHSENLLIGFLKAAQNQNEKFCDLNQAKVFRKWLPLPDDLREKLDHSDDQEIATIIISDSEDEATTKECVNIRKYEENTKSSMEGDDLSNLLESRTEDLCTAIEENLRLQKELSHDIMEDLLLCPEYQVEEIFKFLEDLDSEHIVSLGETLLKHNLPESDFVLVHFVKNLLIKKIGQEYTSNLQKIFCEFSASYFSLISDGLIKYLSREEEVNTKVLSQYIGCLPGDNKTQILRNLLSGIETLQETHISIIESLVDNKLESDLLKKLVSMMCTVADDFSKDKTYGKLLFTILKMFENDHKTLEKPLSHIIANHSSVWKSKAKKLFDSRFGDSLLLTQSMQL